MDPYFVVAPFKCANKCQEIKDANALAAGHTKGKAAKMVFVYEVMPAALYDTDMTQCRPVVAYVGGRSFALRSQPWRSSAEEFAGAFAFTEGAES